MYLYVYVYAVDRSEDSFVVYVLKRTFAMGAIEERGHESEFLEAGRRRIFGVGKVFLKREDERPRLFKDLARGMRLS